MATREQSVFTSTSSLFKPPSPSLLAFQKTTLESYLSELPSFKEILTILNEKAIFLGKEPVQYRMDDFLATCVHLSNTNLNCPPVQLLAEPLSFATTPMSTLTESEHLPEPCLLLADEIACYIAIIGDVLNNQLAQKPYEKAVDLEYVTEQEHALQAGKISYRLNMPLEDILALLLHDIARPSIDDPEHGHSNHCKEGSTILSPLGLAIDYSGYHAFAKYLLYTFCPSYKDLISKTSRRTLEIQLQDLALQLGELTDFPPPQLAFAMYKIMLMRLIDDMSKVPPSELNKRLDGGEPEYFNHQDIQNMLSKQMNRHLNRMIAQSTDITKTLKETKDKLDAALLLLLRARGYSTHPALYEKYHEVIEPLLKGAHGEDGSLAKFF